ncbi:MAG: DNA-directed RNA polymerase subunit beta', partial [Chloroflexi bacterium]|nr:DNA-directed RNA polymerase subunit beta' [Chloroflexota bacterium]
MPQSSEFNVIKIRLASPEQIRAWSYGEVTKPETINYRTLRPERDGLFCERIFGPTKDWECACGKYKKISFRGVKCERCGVEVTRAKVRRERMAHIELAAPVAHIWFSKGVPSRMGLLLDLSPRNLERVLYFAQYIIVSVDEEARTRRREEMEKARDEALAALEKQWGEKVAAARAPLEAGPAEGQDAEALQEAVEQQTSELQLKGAEERAKVEDEYQAQLDDLQEPRKGKLLVESRYRELRDKYSDVFRAGMGAEAILELLKGVDLDALWEQLQQEMRSTSGQRRRKAVKRLRVVDAFRKSANKPEWMILAVLPVLPPELRPMVQLDGGRFATSDLNDLYRRVINRNNRLKRLLELEAPDIIVRNEKRMLQEAVDALIDNGRRGRAIAGSHNHRLKSLSDLLRGKQGRFRQNLLGKRVDYSGRSVIVVGPDLQMWQCGLPKRMALELFKPFVMHRLVVKGMAHNIKSAKRTVERVRPEVWDVLEEVIQNRPVLLNRAPTLHRLGIQAFMPVLIEGSAIQIHPLVCTAFNADFDGDQMAVHVPLSRRAVLEARKVMLSMFNMLSPASGDPIVGPTLDIVLGCFYLTMSRPTEPEKRKCFSSFDEVRLACELGHVGLHEEVRVQINPDEVQLAPGQDERWLVTTTGRAIFRDVLPADLAHNPANWNGLMDKSALKRLVAQCIHLLGNERTSVVLDNIKRLGFHYATVSGISIAIDDLEVPAEKAQLLHSAEEDILRLEEQYQSGLISEAERDEHVVQVWTRAMDAMTATIEKKLPEYGGIYMMAASGAKGNISQIKQMVGMRGLMADPKGRIIALPVKSSFREGLSVLEYFISTHGARKGLADTALRTADSGYLTRRMVDVAQDMIISQEDCGTEQGTWIGHEPEKEKNNYVASFPERINGRLAASPVADPKTGEVLLERNEVITVEKAHRLWQAGVSRVYVRSPLTCETRRGLCSHCYGVQPAAGALATAGEAVGIIAAQSIGEPGTQLTMRTFHTGGVAGVDITSGIPRVEELFEARVSKNPAILSDIDGVVTVEQTPSGKRVRVVSEETFSEEYALPTGYRLMVQEDDQVEAGTPLALPEPSGDGEQSTPGEPASAVVARVGGRVQVADSTVRVVWTEREEREYPTEAETLPANYTVVVKNGETVSAGQVLAAGPAGPALKNPHDILRILGREEVQKYIIEEVQRVYRAQGVSIHDKHIEVIIRQMMRKVKVEHSGDTNLLPGDYVDRFVFEDINKKVLAEGGEPARAVPLLLGITRTALLTESFLAAASFQETTRVLTDAAVQGRMDPLRGLKENVIIGRLIP